MATAANKTASNTTGNTGTQDTHYNLVSILYHALEGAATYDQYIRDAREAGDQELANFFEQVKNQNCDRAETAKSLLKNRI